MLSNCGAIVDFWKSLGQQGDQTSQSQRKSSLNIHWKDWWKLKLQYFGRLMQRSDSLGKTLMLGKTEGRRRRGQQRMMLMFTLAISYLTTSNLPRFMDLTFQLPIQYCSLQQYWMVGWMVGWMTSLTQWTWVWENSGRWGRTGKPGVLQFMGLQIIGHNLATEQQPSLPSNMLHKWEIDAITFKEWKKCEWINNRRKKGTEGWRRKEVTRWNW